MPVAASSHATPTETETETETKSATGTWTEAEAEAEAEAERVRTVVNFAHVNRAGRRARAVAASHILCVRARVRERERQTEGHREAQREGETDRQTDLKPRVEILQLEVLLLVERVSGRHHRPGAVSATGRAGSGGRAQRLAVGADALNGEGGAGVEVVGVVRVRLGPHVPYVRHARAADAACGRDRAADRARAVGHRQPAVAVLTAVVCDM